MSAYVKPIQSTPTLSGEDAKKIIRQVLTRPSQDSVKTYERLARKINKSKSK